MLNQALFEQKDIEREICREMIPDYKSFKSCIQHKIYDQTYIDHFRNTESNVTNHRKPGKNE